MGDENSRIKLIRDSLNMSQAELGDKLNMSQAAIASIESGRRSLRDVHIFQICSVFGVNEDWLRTGEGSMFEESKSISLDAYIQRKGLTDLEVDIIKAYLDIPQEIRRDVANKIKEAVLSNPSMSDPIDEELESYRLELEAKKKGTTSSASESTKDPEGNGNTA